MNHWLKVVCGAVFEVMWVIGLKHAATPLAWIGTIIAIYISFHVIIVASRSLPVGTVYAVFVGLGTAGTVASEMIFFGEPFNHTKMLLVLLLLLGVVGLKLVTGKHEQPEGSEV